MDGSHTFVRNVKAADVCFDQIDDVLAAIRHDKSPAWAIFCFADQQESRNTLKTVARGDDDLSDQTTWPPELFASNALCYGLSRIDFPDDDGLASGFVSFCWKGRSLPIYLRTKYAEFNHVIRDLAQEDVTNLQEQARVLEEQNEYLEIPYDSIRILSGKENELGCGKCATVYRGLWMNENGAAEVAIKLFRYVRLTDKILGDYTKEVAMLRKLRHPNIVLFIGACTDPKLMILTEYCSRKSLYEVIHGNNFASIPWKYKVRMMLDAARGIQYLHSKRIIHRDIKSHNFLVDDDWRVKVADFGISKVLDNDANAFTQCGTTGWVAPEVLLDEDLGYTFKADNWSFAIVMWEMVADGMQNPFIGMAPIKFYNQTVHNGIRPPFPDNVDSEYAALINECWHSNPSDRPSFTEIVSRLEKIVERLGASTEMPPTFLGGYHQCLSTR
ncbi:hypothetical protein P43SY_004895 [Pythium insidiosum]|uniref:Protein kinase domain-containing protein n=1 Tax=Pythium insidiosum TaxID=114742 RepID=A0AAD5QAW9_PYTIN|nr:hypothetical protein P43SY_004895 [Pythium insidiosum]KAJ0409751.1 hypothetical protein ATCC90586_001064 [Pythium insidiosum]